MLTKLRKNVRLVEFLKSLPKLNEHERRILDKWHNNFSGDMELICLKIFILEETIFRYQKASINYVSVVERTSERMCQYVQDDLPVFQDILDDLRQSSRQLSYADGTKEYDKIVRHVIDRTMRNGNHD